MQNGQVSSSIDGPNDLTKLVFPEDWLSKVYLGRCSYDYGFACSSPESQYADLNIWDRFLSTEELVQWTTCQ